MNTKISIGVQLDDVDLNRAHWKKGQFKPLDMNSKISIRVQLDDVEVALEKSLLKGGFYKSLVDYIKRESIQAD